MFKAYQKYKELNLGFERHHGGKISDQDSFDIIVQLLESFGVKTCAKSAANSESWEKERKKILYSFKRLGN